MRVYIKPVVGESRQHCYKRLNSIIEMWNDDTVVQLCIKRRKDLEGLVLEPRPDREKENLIPCYIDDLCVLKTIDEICNM